MPNEPQNAAKVRLIEILCDAVSWGHDTFPQETVQSLANHIAKEAGELALAPTDPDEIADVLMLLAGLIDKLDLDVADACTRKLAENKDREWGEPGPDGVTHHVRRPPGRTCRCGSLLLVPTMPLENPAVAYCLACGWSVPLPGPRCALCAGTGRMFVPKPNGGMFTAPCTECDATGKSS